MVKKIKQNTGVTKLSILLIGGLTVFLIGAFFYLQKKDKSTNSNTIPEPQEVQAPVTTVNIEAGSFFYTPNQIKVKKGERVRIEITSKDMMHDFNIDELNVGIPVTPAGETGAVEFTPDKIGSFEFYCSVGNHRKMGQIGTLIVE